MITRAYLDQVAAWPVRGRHILARYDAESVYVYQAYSSSIARYAVEHQRLGGDDFSYSRMSWIKPNFLWMMYRCGWASKVAQEHVLSVRLRRPFFDELLHVGVSSSFDAARFPSYPAWREAVVTSEVRVQWDPDHDPTGKPLERRALQIGLRGEMLRRYGKDELLSIEDITGFVALQAQSLTTGLEALMLPEERVYDVPAAAARRLGIESMPPR